MFKVTVIKYLIIDEIVLFLHETNDGYRYSELYTGYALARGSLRADGKTPEEVEKNAQKVLKTVGTEAAKEAIKAHVKLINNGKRFFEFD